MIIVHLQRNIVDNNKVLKKQVGDFLMNSQFAAITIANIVFITGPMGRGKTKHLGDFFVRVLTQLSFYQRHLT